MSRSWSPPALSALSPPRGVGSRGDRGSQRYREKESTHVYVQIPVAGKAASRRRDVATPPKSCGRFHGDYFLATCAIDCEGVSPRNSVPACTACSLTCCPAKIHLFPRPISLALVRKKRLSRSPSPPPPPPTTLFLSPSFHVHSGKSLVDIIGILL